MSLRARLTLAIVLVTGPVVAALVLLLYFAVSTALWQEFDREVEETAQIFGTLVEWDQEDGYEVEGGDMIAGMLARGPSPAHIAVHAPDRVLVFDATLAKIGTLEVGDGPVEIVGSHGERLRGMRLRMAPRSEAGHPPAGAIEVTVFRETAGTEATLAAIAGWFWLLGAGTVLLATAVAGVAVHRGMAPFRKLAGELDQIDDPADPLRLRADDLPSELRPVVRKLEALLGRLRQAFERERRFTADVSHELRTPLSVMRASVDVALQLDRDANDYRQRLEQLRQSVDRMTSMVESLLLLSRADAGNLPVRRTQLAIAAIVRECWAPFAAIAAQRGVLFHDRVPVDAIIEADEDKLRMIIGNLLSNAVAYTEPGGWIEVVPSERDGVLLSIVDSGPPIPEEDVGRLFEPFWRGDEARSDAGFHCGIGLALSRALARCQGFDVRVGNRSDGTVAATVEFL